MSKHRLGNRDNHTLERKEGVPEDLRRVEVITGVGRRRCDTLVATQTVAVVSAHAAAPLPIQRRLVAGFPARSAPWLPQTNGGGHAGLGSAPVSYWRPYRQHQRSNINRGSIQDMLRSIGREPHRIRDLQGSWSRIRAAIGLHSTLIPIALSRAGESETLCGFTESALTDRLVHHVETCRSLRAGRSFECRRQAFSLR